MRTPFFAEGYELGLVFYCRSSSPEKTLNFQICSLPNSSQNHLSGVELRPFFTKILASTTFVHFSNPGAKNPSLDAILEGFPSPEAVKPGFCSPFYCHCD